MVEPLKKDAGGERMNIKPIETEYNEYRFRSRAEARWAVFFDACGVKYMYEPEGLKLSDGTMYLPDFYLPESKTYFEVKGLMSDVDMHKITQLQKDLGCSVAIGYSDMTFQASDWLWEDAFTLSDKSESLFVQCMACGKYYFIGVHGTYACLNCGHYDGNCTFRIISEGDSGGKLWRWTDDITINPFKKAKQARFEHGETPE